MIAGSPGPFETAGKTLDMAKEVYKNFFLVTNREQISKALMQNWGFDVSHTEGYCCPSFLFVPSKKGLYKNFVLSKFKEKSKPVVGFILCGWNFQEQPFSKWPRRDNEFDVFIKSVEYITEDLGANVYLMSHSNGFPIPPKPFELQYGRDYVVVKRLKELLDERKVNNVFLQDRTFDAWETKEVIGGLDMLVSGRIHGAVAGLSQCVPTVIIDYGMPPETHKQKGMTKEVDMEDMIANPRNLDMLLKKIDFCWNNRKKIRNHLEKSVPAAQERSRMQFNRMKEVLS